MTTADFERDVIETDAGDLEITFVGHGTLMFTFQDEVIHVDPVSREADYAEMPDADLVLITHGHRDHLDIEALEAVRKPTTIVVVSRGCAGEVEEAIVMENGDAGHPAGLPVEAVPAYNLAHKRPSGEPYHPPGEGNGYVIDFGGTRVYVAGDTENIPEMEELEGIDVAFLPMNLPYTMTPEMAAEAARTIRPDVLYPYHFGDSDVSALVRLLGDTDIEVRVRSME